MNLLNKIIEASDGIDSVIYMSPHTLSVLKNSLGMLYANKATWPRIVKDRDSIRLYYKTFNPNLHKSQSWTEIPGFAWLEIKLDSSIPDDKVRYEVREIPQEDPAQRWVLGFQAPPPKFVKAPIIRGATEIQGLIALLGLFGGFLSGSYASYCCSTRKKVDKNEVGDIDVYLPFTESFYSFCNELKELGFKEQRSVYSYYYTCPPAYSNRKMALSKTPAFAQLYGGLFLSDKAINVVRPESMDLSGLEKFKDTDELIPRFAARVLSLFDSPVCRAAILSERLAIADESFANADISQTAVFDSFRSPDMLCSRIQKYKTKGYSVEVLDSVRSHHLLKNHQGALNDALLSPPKPKATFTLKKDSGAHTP